MRIRLLKLLFLSLAMVPAGAVAQVRLIVWQPSPQAPQIILAARSLETDAQAVQRYLGSVHADPELKTLLPPEGLSLKIGKTQNLGPQTSRVKLAMIANVFEDLTGENGRIQRNTDMFKKAGADAFIIPIAADIGLSPEDTRQFQTRIAETFSLLVALGGHDVHPQLYGEQITHSEKTNLHRDQSELSLIKRFKELAKGVFFGICRGHQIGAVADGHSLNQNISNHINPGAKSLLEAQKYHHIWIEADIMNRLGLHIPEVNSLHHQAVRLNPQAESLPIAFARDGTIEALRMKNGLGFSTQFHPEFPSEISGNNEFSLTGFALIKKLVVYARLKRVELSRGHSLLCKRIFVVN